MHFTSIPRHELNITLREYARILGALVRPGGYDREIAIFEREFAAYLGCRHAIVVSSGRLGIHLLLEALNFAPGDEVIVPAFNLYAVVERFCQFGLVPRFADVRRSDLNVDADDVARLINPKTKAILATHMFGHPADMTALRELAHQNGLTIIEDCAHALGTRLNAQLVGTFGQASIFSFSVLKLISTFGGGMITTNDDMLAASIRDRLGRLQALGQKSRGVKQALTGAVMDIATRRMTYSFGAWPALRLLKLGNDKLQRQIMTETPKLDRMFNPTKRPPFLPFQARLGRSQLNRVDAIIARRRAVGQMLDERLEGIPGVRMVASGEEGEWNGLYYGILAERAEELCDYLFRKGVDAETSEYRNCASMEMYGTLRRNCPVARHVEAGILRLPNNPSLTEADVARICDTIKSFYAQGHSHKESVAHAAMSGA